MHEGSSHLTTFHMQLPLKRGPLFRQQLVEVVRIIYVTFVLGFHDCSKF
jgi:hypothetical protein